MWSSGDGEAAGQTSVRSRKHEVLATWRRLVIREDADLARLDPAALIVPIEAVFDRLIDLLEGTNRGNALQVTIAAHTDERFRAGVRLDSVLREYASLHQCVLAELKDFYPIHRLAAAIGAATLHVSRRYLEAHDAVRERFIGVLAHDLRTPLACTTMAAEMLLVTERPERDHALLEHILDASERMRRMVGDVLSWARTSNGEFPLVLAAGDVGAVLRAAVDEARLAFGEDAILLEQSGDLRAELDADRLHQAIANLLHNAIEHGAGIVHVDARELLGGDTIVVVVRNGGALRTPNSSGVTDPFKNRNQATKARGLGLFIVDQIARAHGAMLDVDSTIEQTTVTLRLPTRRSQQR
jgi:signal transduction histidine kinase